MTANRVAAGLALILAALAYVPGVDILASGLFYSEKEWFFWRYVPVLEFVRKSLPQYIIGAGVLFLSAGVVNLIFKKRFLNMTKEAMLYLVLTMGLGPGLVVNLILKENWGRARPTTVTEFGGKLAFTPPFVISDQCADNCSFASGHASIAFWTVALALLAPKPWRTPLVWTALVFGFLIGMVRVVQGAHFLSDVVTAGLITVGIAFALRPWLLKDRFQA